MRKQFKKFLYKSYYEKYIKDIHTRSVFKREYNPILKLIEATEKPNQLKGGGGMAD